MNNMKFLIAIFLLLVITGCGIKDNKKNYAVIEKEIDELKAVSYEDALNAYYYNLSLGEDNSRIAKMKANSLENIGIFQYVDEMNGEMYIGNVIKKNNIVAPLSA